MSDANNGGKVTGRKRKDKNQPAEVNEDARLALQPAYFKIRDAIVENCRLYMLSSDGLGDK